MNEPLARFIGLYQQLDKQQLHRLPEDYAEQVVFTDPAHRTEGLAALGDYFAALYQRLAYCRFVITSQQQQGQQAWLSWTMTFSHPRLRGGEPVTVEGPPALSSTRRARCACTGTTSTLAQCSTNSCRCSGPWCVPSREARRTSGRVLITGATSGIGRQLALDYRRAGWQEWGHGCDGERLQELGLHGITPLQFDARGGRYFAVARPADPQHRQLRVNGCGRGV